MGTYPKTGDVCCVITQYLSKKLKLVKEKNGQSQRKMLLIKNEPAVNVIT